MIAKEMELPWRAVESMHWQMGQEDLASRANVPVFQPHAAPMTKVPTIKRKASKSPPTAGSDSSRGRGPTPSTTTSRFTRGRHGDSSSNHSPRKRNDSKTDKISLDLTQIMPSQSGSVANHDEQHGASPIYHSRISPTSGSLVHDDSGGSVGPRSIGDKDWEHAQTPGGSTPRARSDSINSAASQSSRAGRTRRLRTQ
jgi:hypothetical protein